MTKKVTKMTDHNPEWRYNAEFAAFLKKFGRHIKAMRLAKKKAAANEGVFTQEYFDNPRTGKKGRGIQIDIKYFQKIEAGSVNASLFLIWKLARKLEIDIEELFKDLK